MPHLMVMIESIQAEIELGPRPVRVLMQLVSAMRMCEYMRRAACQVQAQVQLLKAHQPGAEVIMHVGDGVQPYVVQMQYRLLSTALAQLSSCPHVHTGLLKVPQHLLHPLS